MKISFVIPVVAVVAIAAAGCPREPAVATPFQLLQANVGTARLDAGRYVYKLNDVAAERAIAAGIVALDPDVVALQEVLPDHVCDAIDDEDGGEDDAGRACHVDVRAEVPRQIDRLLPPADWAVVCEPRQGYECVGVRRGRGVIVGSYRSAPAVVIDDEGCDDGFTVGRVDVQLDVQFGGGTVAVLNGHPQSTNSRCRAAQVAQLFALDDDNDASDGVDAAVVTGDMNLDPFGFGLDEDDESVVVWNEHVGDDDDGRAFVYASGTAERLPPYPTTRGLFEAVLDHVAVRAGSGRCTTLGEAPGTILLDGERSVMDHRALNCAVSVP